MLQPTHKVSVYQNIATGFEEIKSIMLTGLELWRLSLKYMDADAVASESTN